MPDKKIQEQFGENVMQLVADFAKSDIRTVAEHEQFDFDHVGDPVLRRAIAETLYGARWLYKLGVALWLQDVEHYAHVRAQVVDYGSVCEAVLSSMIVHGVTNDYFSGQQWRYFNFNKNPESRIRWANPSQAIEKTSFEWRIRVAREERIIDDNLRLRLSKLKGRRNSVHLTQKVSSNISYYIGLSRSAFNTITKTIDQTKAWKAAHP